MTLYEKKQVGKSVRYVEYVPEPAMEKTYNLNDAECLTVAASLGVTLLTIFTDTMPAHKLCARKIQAVQDSLLELYRGTGQKIDENIAVGIFKAWDKAMLIISTEGVEV